jgi:hypothetical protein
MKMLWSARRWLHRALAAAWASWIPLAARKAAASRRTLKTAAPSKEQFDIDPLPRIFGAARRNHENFVFNPQSAIRNPEFLEIRQPHNGDE